MRQKKLNPWADGGTRGSVADRCGQDDEAEDLDWNPQKAQKLSAWRVRKATQPAARVDCVAQLTTLTRKVMKNPDELRQTSRLASIECLVV